MNGLVKLALEMGPLAVFFLGNARFGIFPATAAFMIATLISLVLSFLLLRRIPIMPLITGVFVLVFGGLTLYLQDELFIKIKPTIINLMFASALGVGLLFGRSLVKIVLGEVIQLHDDGWRILTMRWAGFFVILAVVNEIVWRSFSTETWMAFKLFGVAPLSFLFMMSQVGLLQKYQLTEDAPQPAEK
jgi:intracellular septation protein